MRIIYFDIDCLRPDHLGCYGYQRPTSPCIDSIAAEGTRFNHCYGSSSPCLPSRAAWSSGRFGIRNGVISNVGPGAQFYCEHHGYGGPKQENEFFQRHIRKEAGWDSISFTTFADRHSAQWFMTGWSEFHTPNLKCGGDDASEINAKVLPWLEHHKGDDNYFLHVHYWNVHRAYFIDGKWGDRFKDYPVTQEFPSAELIAQHQDLQGPFVATNQPFPAKDGGAHNKSPYPLMPDYIGNRKDFEHVVTGYDATIAYVDHHIKQIVDLLKEQGLYEDTAIIISADHGDAFGEHGIYTDHCFADECIHRLPMIVRWPGVARENASDDSFIYNLDMGPSICDLIGTEAPSAWDGMSFAPQLRGEEGGPDREYLVWDTALYARQRAVRSKQHLYIRTYDPGQYEHIPAYELFDMVHDPYQQHNIAAEHPELVEKYQRIMDTWVAEQQAKPFSAQEDPLLLACENRLPV